MPIYVQYLIKWSRQKSADRNLDGNSATKIHFVMKDAAVTSW